METPDNEARGVYESPGAPLDCGPHDMVGAPDIDGILLSIVPGPDVGAGRNVKNRVCPIRHGGAPLVELIRTLDVRPRQVLIWA